MKDRKEKRKLVNNIETITSWSTEILLPRHAEKVGKGWAWQHNGFTYVFKWVYSTTLAQKVSL